MIYGSQNRLRLIDDHAVQLVLNRARKMYHVEEFGVHPDFHRQGAATALVEYMKKDAAERGYPRIELDMWEFNQGALAFYENAGFTTYRRFMELWVD